jgi:hypothetical protein
MLKQQVDYQEYLASREWRVKRKKFIEEATYGVCQRCADRPIENVHHLTYANMGDEDWGDLMGLCRPCHEYLAGERDEDPALEVIQCWIAKHGLRLAKIWPGKITGSWPWPPLESSNPEHNPSTLRMVLLPESQYRDFAPIFSLHLPRMTVGPGVLAIFDWL